MYIKLIYVQLNQTKSVNIMSNKVTLLPEIIPFNN